MNWDLENSFVIGDRLTDVELATNSGSKAIYISGNEKEKNSTIVLQTTSWKEIYEFLKFGQRKAEITRKTKETDIILKVNLDGTGKAKINTGIKFFDHMLEQISKHGLIDLQIEVKSDLEVDEHHTIEDTAIVLGEAVNKAMKNKLGMERYGFLLPMDDSLAQVAIDFGGRSWINWSAEFKREKIGEMPTENEGESVKEKVFPVQTGMQVEKVTKDIARELELSHVEGLVITEVIPGSSADDGSAKRRCGIGG